MAWFEIHSCVIDAMPETHLTREFAKRFWGQVFMCFFNEHQRGEPNFDSRTGIVQVNRTEALDFSREVVREGRDWLPQGHPELETFARHMAADATILEEDEETGSKRYKYVKAGADHYSLAFTYATLAAENCHIPFVV